MISKARFCKLKRGDVILWNGNPRYILQGPGDSDTKPTDPTCHMYVHFPIRRRSWTGRAYTIYGYHDCKHAMVIPRRRFSPQAICVAEKEQLGALGFDWLAELEREVREHDDLIRRARLAGLNEWADRLASERSFRAAKAQLKRNLKKSS